ncbi:MAG TPA: acyltransferase [Candidatus Dormibacteraeota bacterium]|nr:acyltransferase [Candidatus Dormibacteraeota bacterium]
MRLIHTILDHYKKPRVLGLDLLRITASLSIIGFHGNSSVFLGKNLAFQVLGNNGYLAVDIFFVLSGWLLTRQVLRMRSSFTSGWAFAWRFWTRRWARILPPYVLVLIVLFLFGNALLPHLHRDPVLLSSLTFPQLVVHSLFLQTLFPPNALGVSWSLVTEEWFYLLLPLVVLLLLPRLRRWQMVMGLGCVVLLIPAVVRVIMLATGDRASIVYTPQARFEGLVVGSLLAAASLGAPWWETQVIARRRLLFATGLVVMLPILLAGISHSWAFNVFGLLGFSLCLGLLMPLLSQLRWPQHAPVTAVIAVAYLSELTYPLYLLHMFRPTFSTTSSVGLAVVFAVLLLLAATVLHLGVERPFLALRDRFDTRRTAWKEPAVAAAPPVAERPAVWPLPAVSPRASG